MSNGLNSGYIATDQRRTQAGVVSGRKHYLERLSGLFDGRTLWTPARLSPGPTLWLDASDSSTVTSSVLGSNLAVFDWRDKSGNNRHVSQSIVSSRPYYITASWGSRLPILDFDGVNDFMTGSAAISNIITAATYSAFVVGLAVTASGTPQFAYQSDAFYGDTGGYISMYVTASGNAGAYNYVSGVTGDVATGSYTFGSASLFYAEHSGSNIIFRLNAGTAVSASSGNTFSLLSSLQVGRQFNSNDYCLDGEIGEVIFTSQSLSNSNRQLVEGYLAHKWGLTANLPSNHPYKEIPPLI